MNRTKTIVVTSLSLVLSIYPAGCGNKFWDPTQIGRFRPTPAVNVILDSLGVAEEPSVAWEKAEEPRPSDIVAVPTDYVFTPGDVIRISIFELFQDDVTFINDYVVTETGKISIPEVGIIQAAGLTETQLEDQIKRIVSPGLLKEPAVSVALLSSQQRRFSILGDGVSVPGRYVIPRYDFRLTDALAAAGGPRQFNVSYIYVSRPVREREKVAEPVEMEAPKPEFPELEVIEPEVPKPRVPERGIPELKIIEPKPDSGGKLSFKLEREMLGMITPSSQPRWPESKKMVIASTEVTGTSLDSRSSRLDSRQVSSIGENEVDGRIEWVFRNGQWIPIQIGPAEPTELAVKEDEVGERIEWIFKDGQWVPVQIGPPEPTEPAVKEEEVGERIEWIFKDGQWIPIRVGPPKLPKPIVPPEVKIPEQIEWEAAVQTRVIKIPVAKLLAGDPRYNIVIKPGDTINVPVDIIGEFAIMGNVNRTGYINITGRPMTLKMAIAAAGGLGPLAWPKRCEVIRRIGENQEEIVRVDLDKIASGEQPDFFIKPNDLINVGTHATARWRAVLRNAFRITYGWGFVYDRNFAYKDYYETTFNPITPWKWDKVF